MKMTYNRHKHTDELYDVTLILSPYEVFIIKNALRHSARASGTNPKSRLIVRQLLADMERNESNGQRQQDAGSDAGRSDGDPRTESGDISIR